MIEVAAKPNASSTAIQSSSTNVGADVGEGNSVITSARTEEVGIADRTGVSSCGSGIQIDGHAVITSTTNDRHRGDVGTEVDHVSTTTSNDAAGSSTRFSQVEGVV